MEHHSKRLAGILLIILPTVLYGGVSLLTFLIDDPAYIQNPLRQDLFRAGHAHAGVLLILSLVALLYIDQTTLSAKWKTVVRYSIPLSAVFLPAGFFFQYYHRTQQNRMALFTWLTLALSFLHSA